MRRLSGLLCCAVTIAAAALSNTSLSAQDTTRTARPDTARQPADTQPTPPPPAPAASLPFDFSGIIYANYQYGGVKGNRSVNRFEVERAYLTFRATPGEHFSFASRPTCTSSAIPRATSTTAAGPSARSTRMCNTTSSAASAMS